jgi:Ca-activated chloride channel family protein
VIPPPTTVTTPDVEPPRVPPGAFAADVIVLLTDGDNNTGPAPLDAATEAAARGIRIYTIGFGTAAGGPLLPGCVQRSTGREPAAAGGFTGGPARGAGGRSAIDEPTLRAVASLTGGSYHPAQNAAELEQVFADLPTSLITEHDVREVSVVFVALGAVCASISFLLARLWRPWP